MLLALRIADIVHTSPYIRKLADLDKRMSRHSLPPLLPAFIWWSCTLPRAGGAQCPRQGEIPFVTNSLICAKGVFRSQSPRALSYLTEKCFHIQPTGVASPLYVCGLFEILISKTSIVYCRYDFLSSKPPTTCHQAKSFIFSCRLLHQPCLRLNSFFKVSSRWQVVGGRCRCRPLSAMPFLSQPSVSTRPFPPNSVLCLSPAASVKRTLQSQSKHFSQMHPSDSVL